MEVDRFTRSMTCSALARYTTIPLVSSYPSQTSSYGDYRQNHNLGIAISKINTNAIVGHDIMNRNACFVPTNKL